MMVVMAMMVGLLLLLANAGSDGVNFRVIDGGLCLCHRLNAL